MVAASDARCHSCWSVGCSLEAGHLEFARFRELDRTANVVGSHLGCCVLGCGTGENCDRVDSDSCGIVRGNSGRFAVYLCIRDLEGDPRPFGTTVKDGHGRGKNHSANCGHDHGDIGGPAADSCCCEIESDPHSIMMTLAV